MNTLTVVLLSALVLQISGQDSYEGYQLHTFEPQNVDHLRLIGSLEHEGVDVWSTPIIGKPASVLFGPHQMDHLETLVNTEMPHELIDTNIMRQLEKNYEARQEDLKKPYTGKYKNTRYLTMFEIETLMQQYEDYDVNYYKKDTIGITYENRDISVLKMWRDGADRRAIWIDAGGHAREWLSTAVAMCIMDRLVMEDGVDPAVTQIRDAFDVYVQPEQNPDGYEYSWSGSSERLWRKTRRPNSGDPSCPGTDTNRNYDFVWGGGSTNLCSQTYQGPFAQSESEVNSHANYVVNRANTIDLYLNLHTYGEYIFCPWSYTLDPPPNDADMHRVANAGVAATNANSTENYFVYDALQDGGSGVGMDWALGFAQIKYSYAWELRDTGNGFEHPPDEIQPACNEIFAGLHAMAMDIQANG